MSKHRRHGAAFTLVAIAVGTAAACDESAAGPNAEQASPGEDKSTAAESQPGETKDSANGRAALARYEAVRAALATDTVAATTAHAAILEKSARSAATAGTGDVSQKWVSVAEAAKRLQEMSKDDADSVRRAFGEVSRHMIAVLTADEALAEGLHVFECPMAQGYKKWVQPAAKISNPYMGTRMPECGSESSL